MKNMFILLLIVFSGCTASMTAQEFSQKIRNDPKIRAAIDINLNAIFNTEYSEMTSDEFIKLVKVKTDDFNPLNEKTALLIFGAQNKGLVEYYMGLVNAGRYSELYEVLMKNQLDNWKGMK